MERKADLSIKRDVFINGLVLSPMDNERFTATFTRLSPNSGDVIFQDKNSGKMASAKWGVHFTSDSLVVNLVANNLLILETDYQQFRNRVEATIIIS